MEDVNVTATAPSATQGELQGRINAIEEEIKTLDGKIRKLDEEWEEQGYAPTFSKLLGLNSLKSERDSLKEDRKRLDSLLKDLQPPHVSDSFIQALKELKEELKEVKEEVKNQGVALSDDLCKKVLPLIVGLIGEKSHCVGVGSFVGKRLILTAYHNLVIDGKVSKEENSYKFRTSGNVAGITYKCTLLQGDEKEDWALLSSDVEAPGYLEVPDVTTLTLGQKVVMLGFGIGLPKDDPFVDAGSFAIEALYPDSIQMKASYISSLKKHYLLLDWGTFGGDSGSAIILASNGAIVGMHVMHYNNAEPLPPSPPDVKKGKHGKGKKRRFTSASSPPSKESKQERQDAFNEDVKKSVRSLTASTSHVGMALIVPNLKSVIDELNKALASSSVAAASPAVVTSSSSTEVSRKRRRRG